MPNVVFVVGLGPGDPRFLTAQAQSALTQAEVLCGYTVYLDLVRPYFPDKLYYSTGMTKEIDRCRWALEKADTGRRVVMVCSGDAGVYGMAGLIYELAQQYPPIEIEVIPGITAAMSGAAVLGAPLIHDFAVISLSDLLTPLEKIMTRVELAAQADFVLCFYNPASKKRADYLKHACELILKHRSPDTPCGYVRNIGREGQEAHVMTLRELQDAQVDMFTTVFVGNSQTRRIGDKLVTPRGYKNV